MKNNYDVYIKGRAHDDVASCAIIVVENDVEIFSGGMNFDRCILTNEETIPLLPYKAQYQMELYALAWALTKCKENSFVNVYTNNVVFATWIERWIVGADYEPVFQYCKRFCKGKSITPIHVKKGDNTLVERCNEIAFEYEYY